MRRNLFFILVDCLRADHCYGERGSAKTPVLNRLRQGGTWFNQAIAVSGNTTPCTGSIMTGLYPFAHKLQRKGGPHRQIVACSTLAEILQRHGYHTSAMVAGTSLLPDNALSRGFEVYQHRQREEHLYTLWRTQLHVELDRLSRQHEPWFFLLHLYEIHFPRQLSPAFDRAEFGTTDYERALSSLDNEVGEILERIDLEQTLVIVLGDHGDRFGKWGIVDWLIRGMKWHLMGWHSGMGWYKLGHGYHVYDFLVRVPLILTAQGLFPAGTQIDAQVRQIDIMPTILQALGIPLDPEIKIHGRSLFPLVKGQQMEVLPALMEASSQAIPDPRNWLRGIRVPPWKYVFAPRNPRIRPELYHLGEDPDESKNLVDQHPAIAESLRRTIVDITSGDDDHLSPRSMSIPSPGPQRLPRGS